MTRADAEAIVTAAMAAATPEGGWVSGLLLAPDVWKALALQVTPGAVCTHGGLTVYVNEHLPRGYAAKILRSGPTPAETLEALEALAQRCREAMVFP